IAEKEKRIRRRVASSFLGVTSWRFPREPSQTRSRPGPIPSWYTSRWHAKAQRHYGERRGRGQEYACTAIRFGGGGTSRTRWLCVSVFAVTFAKMDRFGQGRKAQDDYRNETARAFCAIADRVSARRRRAHGLVQLAVCAA